VLVSAVLHSRRSITTRATICRPCFSADLYGNAWYHHLLAPDLQKLTIEQVAQQARDFADGEYAQALMKGDRLTSAEKQKTAQDLSRFTGLSTKYLEETNLRIRDDRWFKELERDKRRTVGRLDSRFEGMDADAPANTPKTIRVGQPTKAPGWPRFRITRGAI